jgi:phosphohistidine swiveling domain-containing protein
VPDVYGETTVLGQMPDWNPAEMIGRAPRALAFSLYKKLITDHAWRISRASMGYAVPTGRPLMVSLAGQPYIDTRLSFHSFIPAKLPPNIAEKLVNAWIRRLSEYPHLHDKVEFDVAITTYSFDFSEKLRALVGNTLTDEECQVYKCVLREQTRSLLMMGHEGSLANALQKINALLERQKKNNNLSGQNDISNLYKMLEDCIQLGTIPFSVLARHAFIAKTILMSLRHKGILTTQDVMCIQSSVRTVAGELVDDMHRMQLRDMAKEEFMSIYGHLRPGTYDILSRRYDQMTDFISSKPTFQAKKTEPEFNLSKRQRDEIDYLLEAEGFSELKAENIMDYLKESIAGREYAKFVFTRTVSDILELIAAYGERHCLSREEMSHISIDCLLEEMSRSGEGGLEERLRLIAAREAECHELTVAIRLPQVLFDEAGVHVIPFQVNHPNFITNKKVIAPVVVLEARADAAYHLAGKIILIENADPGFDWIFAQSIVGLITKYGGANSHMAIRCAEFGIAAAIGCGEQRYEAFVNSSQISMDCAAGLISPLH